MFCQNELDFLCDTLRKNRVRVSLVNPTDAVGAIMDVDTYALFGSKLSSEMPLCEVIGTPEPRTVYKLTDEFGLHYIYFILPISEGPSLVFVGPYLATPFLSRQLMEYGEKNGISPKNQKYFFEYFSNIPILESESPLLVMISTFCERLWDSPSFAVIDADGEFQLPTSPINEPALNDDFSDALVNMKAMEKRYSFENEIMQAVALGQLHKESLLLSRLGDQTYEKRLPDLLRNSKNYSIIMNTLLRKAAESGGVHPVYLDRVSSQFAQKIEQLPSVHKASALMREIFHSYCRLVRKHSMKGLSPIVQKAVLLIDSDLSANLTLGALAEAQNVSSGYLATVFKKDTGKTVSEYVREKRVNYAKHLLTTTQLQVQTIALHCGVMDVQYFTKIFKKQTGKTPKEYRELATKR